MIPQRLRLVGCMVLVLAVVAACQPGRAPPTELPVAAPTALEPVPENEAPPAEPDVTSETEQPEAAAPAPTATVDVSPNLRATDPSTVSLAAGHPQLVEFFAFW